MFKFGFSEDSTKDNEDITIENEVDWLPSEEIFANNEKTKTVSGNLECDVFRCGSDIDISYISPDIIVKVLQENGTKSDIVHAENSHSDLISGVYEGGLKIWECTFDLANFICNESILLKDKNVLDLGCGMGLIGILSLLKGADVDFQDYNVDVLQYITIPNVLLNTKEGDILSEKCKFYSGDWKSFVDVRRIRSDIKYDYIFTSETIYNTGNYGKLINAFKNLLKSDGEILLAAKTYYFGVGGGLREFEEHLQKDGTFNHKTGWKCSEGVSREILKLSFK